MKSNNRPKLFALCLWLLLGLDTKYVSLLPGSIKELRTFLTVQFSLEIEFIIINGSVR